MKVWGNPAARAITLSRHSRPPFRLPAVPPASDSGLSRAGFLLLDDAMADIDNVLICVVAPGLQLLPSKMDTPAARVMLLAIGLQESRFEHRRQIGGPARGFWQFERGGGVHGVLRHRSTAELADHVCAERGVEPTPAGVYGRLEHDDLLACSFARLLLWTDPKALPAPGYAAASWDYYIRTWRPGKPHRHTWDALYARAVEAVAG